MIEIFDEVEFEDEVEAVSIPWDYKVENIGTEFAKVVNEKIEGTEALKQWAFFALSTARYRYRAFSWEYGSEIEDLIGKGYDDEYIKSEVQRMVEDCLTENPYIDSVNFDKVEMEDTTLSVSLTAYTTFGEVELDTDLEVG